MAFIIQYFFVVVAAAFLVHVHVGVGSHAFRLGDKHHTNKCPPFNKGTFNIYQYQLYPDNAAFDFDNCVLYIRCVYSSETRSEMKKVTDWGGVL